MKKYSLLCLFLLLPVSLFAQKAKGQTYQEMYADFSDTELEIETSKLREKRRRSVRTLVIGIEFLAGGVVSLIAGGLTSKESDQLSQDLTKVWYVLGGISVGAGAAIIAGGGAGIGINSNKLKAIDEEKLRRSETAQKRLQNAREPRPPHLSFLFSPNFIGVNFSL